MTLFVRTDANFTVPGLPQVVTEYVPPIDGAAMDFDTSRLALGALPAWQSSISSDVLAVYSGEPQVVEDGGQKAINLDSGSGDMLRVLYSNRVHTSIIVQRFTDPKPYESVHFGTANGQGYLYVTGRGDNYGAQVGTAGSVFNPPLTPDDRWHVFVTVNNGENSFVNIDGQHQNVSGNTDPRIGYALGWRLAEPYRSDSMYRRFAIIPEVISPDRAAAIVGLLMDHYGI